MTEDTQARLKAIAERAEKATPGPWFMAGVRFRMNGGEWHGIHRYDEAGKRDENISCVGYDPRTGVGMTDAQFIAHAREDIPFLLAEIARLSALTSREEVLETLLGVQRVNSEILAFGGTDINAWWESLVVAQQKVAAAIRALKVKP